MAPEKKTVQFLKTHHKKIFIALLAFYLICLAGSFFGQKKFPFVNSHCLNKPIIQDDYALHYASSIESSTYLKRNHRIWGYNPYYSAGYPGGIVLSLSNHWAILFNFILGTILGPSLAFNLSIFIALLILPLLAYLTARNFEFGKLNSLFFLIFSTLFILGFNKIGAFISDGMYGFSLAIFLSFCASSFLFKYLQKKRNFDLVLLAAFGSIAFFVHPFSSLLCFVLCLPMVVFYFKKISFRDIIKLALCIFVILLANLFWLLPPMKFSELMSRPYPFFESDPSQIISLFKSNPPFILMFFLFLFFLYRSFREKKYRFAGCMASSFVLLFTLTFFSSQIGLPKYSETGRFIIALSLLFVLAFSKIIIREIERKSLFFIPAMLLLMLLLLFFFMRTPVKFQCGFHENPEAYSILKFIKKNTSEKARIHVQDSHQHPYFGSHFTALVPHIASRESLASSYTYPGTKLKFTQFVDDIIFEKNLNEISPHKLKEYIELYNLKYFLVFSDDARAFFNKIPECVRVFNQGIFSIYDYTDSDESFCFRCKATVKADYDRIIVENASSNVTILKYHYIDVLKVEPASIEIEPIELLDDPVPFILVRNGDHSRFIIYND